MVTSTEPQCTRSTPRSPSLMRSGFISYREDRTMMTDQEIGELWDDAKAFYGQPSGEGYWQSKVIELIRVIVEERRRQHYPNIHGTDGYAEALRDFGIDPEDFNE